METGAQSSTSRVERYNRVVLVTLVLSFVVGVGALFWQMNQLQQDLIRRSALESARLYSDAVAQFRTVYTSEVVGAARAHGMRVTHDYYARADAIPLPATLSMLLGKRLGESGSGAQARLYSAYPFPWRAAESARLFREDFVRRAWANWQRHPESREPFFEFTEVDGRASLRFAVPDRMRKECVSCHNTHPDSPKRDWEMGDVRGVLETIAPLHATVRATEFELRRVYIAVGAASIVALLLLILVITRLGRWGSELERGVEERTEALARQAEELHRAAEAAQAADRAKGAFLATMSHEIRTPMNGVVGMTTLLLNTELTDEQRDYASTCRVSGEALMAIINDILDFSKIEAGKLQLDPVPFDLLVLLEEVAEQSALKAHAKDVEFALDCAPEVPHRLLGDAGRIRQVVTNVVSNAVKFTAAGHVLIRVTSELLDPLRARLHISVTDTGVGIAAGRVAEMFQRFTQADASTTRRYGGTGLGLAISAELVELMGGEMGVDSEAGVGSTFWFEVTLPIDRSAPTPVGSASDLEGTRVLIVDDHEVNRAVLHNQITSWGMRSGAYASGPAALEAMREAARAGDPFQIAIIDYTMPGMDGPTLGRAIKADPELRDTALVLLTAVGRRGDAAVMSEIGFAGYVVKPVRQRQLLSVLATVWDAHLTGEPTPLVTRHTVAESAHHHAAPIGDVGARVLVVEDNPVNLAVARALLGKMGCEVDAAVDGREAVAKVAARPYDLVFMDCQMPDMDGFEATARIRSTEAARCPIIAMTANAMAGDRERCLAAGMDDYVSKPITPRVLDDVLRRWLPRDDA